MTEKEAAYWASRTIVDRSDDLSPSPSPEPARSSGAPRRSPPLSRGRLASPPRSPAASRTTVAHSVASTRDPPTTLVVASEDAIRSAVRSALRGEVPGDDTIVLRAQVFNSLIDATGRAAAAARQAQRLSAAAASAFEAEAHILEEMVDVLNCIRQDATPWQ